MAKPQNVIGGRCPPTVPGYEWDCQCARCGSSLESEECNACCGIGVIGHDCGEDTCCCKHPEDNIPCDICGGRGRYWVCMSTRAYCHTQPMHGRDGVASGTPEWYAVEEGVGNG